MHNAEIAMFCTFLFRIYSSNSHALSLSVQMELVLFLFVQQIGESNIIFKCANLVHVICFELDFLLSIYLKSLEIDPKIQNTKLEKSKRIQITRNPCEIEIRSFKLPSRFIWAMIYSYLIYFACIAQLIKLPEPKSKSKMRSGDGGMVMVVSVSAVASPSSTVYTAMEMGNIQILSLQFPIKFMFS